MKQSFTLCRCEGSQNHAGFRATAAIYRGKIPPSPPFTRGRNNVQSFFISFYILYRCSRRCRCEFASCCAYEAIFQSKNTLVLLVCMSSLTYLARLLRSARNDMVVIDCLSRFVSRNDMVGTGRDLSLQKKTCFLFFCITCR